MTGVAGERGERLSRGVNADRGVRIDDLPARAIDAAHLRGARGLVDPESVEIGANARQGSGGDRE